jgi:3-oxoacyl-[acyl-carrier protein] reductase
MTRYTHYDLSGCKALVTGGASGIGLGTATMLAQSGATVAINHLVDDPRGGEAVARLRAEGLQVVAAPGRVGDPGKTERMVEDAVAALGGLDLLVNNAGTPGVKATVPPRRLDLVTDELGDAVLSTNLVGMFRCTKAAAPALKAAHGAVVNVASIAAFGLVPGSSVAYSASKAGVVNLTKSLARALAPEVRVNAIAPGAVDSTWLDWTPEQRQWDVEKSLLKRIGSPADYADVILFLAFGTETVTGGTVVVDAGLMLGVGAGNR